MVISRARNAIEKRRLGNTERRREPVTTNHSGKQTCLREDFEHGLDHALRTCVLHEPVVGDRDA